MKKIAITGATGFIGQRLVKELSRRGHALTALTRSSAGATFPPEVTVKSCDLYSLKQIEQAVEGCDVAIYLVHSMLPTASLDQGSFADFDYILADNFARACASANVKQIVYLGGIIPSGEHLSAHLASRQEVENILNSYPTPVKVLRAPMILGDGGSSFQIMTKLVRRLPTMLCPTWTQSKSEPVAVNDVIEAIALCCEAETPASKTYDIVGPHSFSYMELMKLAAQEMGLKRRFIAIPYIPVELSRLWVTLITGAPYELVQPLTQSLTSDMLSDPDRRFPFPEGYVRRPIADVIQESMRLEKRTVPRAFQKMQLRRKTVRSIQRLPLPRGWSAQDVAEYYMEWLPKYFRVFISVNRKGDTVEFLLLRLKRMPLLILKFSPERSTKNRPLFYVIGGLLGSRGEKGRLEFRASYDQTFVLAAIHSFEPKLPWVVYRLTQAVAHQHVMHAFGRALRTRS